MRGFALIFGSLPPARIPRLTDPGWLMSSVLSIAISGMQAAATRLEISARNVANVRSAGALPDAQGNFSADAPRAYTPQRVDQVDLSGGGTQAIVSNVAPSS